MTIFFKHLDQIVLESGNLYTLLHGQSISSLALAFLSFCHLQPKNPD